MLKFPFDIEACLSLFIFRTDVSSDFAIDIEVYCLVSVLQIQTQTVPLFSQVTISFDF